MFMPRYVLFILLFLFCKERFKIPSLPCFLCRMAVTLEEVPICSILNFVPVFFSSSSGRGPVSSSVHVLHSLPAVNSLESCPTLEV